MAKAYISEYGEMPRDASGDTVPVPSEPAIATQSVTFTTTNPSAAFNSKTKYIRVVADAKAHFRVSKAPKAVVGDPYLPAHVPEYFGVRQGHKIAFYDGSS